MTIAYLDDWVVLYLDGKLARQGHSLTAEHLLEELGIEYDWVEADSEFYTYNQIPELEKDIRGHLS